MPSDAVDEDDAVAKTISQVVCGVQDSDTHSTAGSTGQSGSYNSVSPTDLTASSRTLIAQLPKKHHASHECKTRSHGSVGCRTQTDMAQEAFRRAKYGGIRVGGEHHVQEAQLET